MNILRLDMYLVDKMMNFVGTNAGYSQVNSAANLWVSGGCSSSKLVLGLASYGYDYNLINPSRNGVGASATGGI